MLMICLKRKNKNMQVFRISVRPYCWVEHIKIGNQSEQKIQARVATLKKPDNVNSKLNSIIDELIVNIENAQLHESGLIIKYITKFKIGYGGFRIPTGSSYIDLPLWIKNKKACINIQNDDNRCLMYVVQCGVYEIYKKQYPEIKSHYDNDRFKKTNTSN